MDCLHLFIILCLLCSFLHIVMSLFVNIFSVIYFTMEFVIFSLLFTILTFSYEILILLGIREVNVLPVHVFIFLLLKTDLLLSIGWHHIEWRLKGLPTYLVHGSHEKTNSLCIYLFLKICYNPNDVIN